MTTAKPSNVIAELVWRKTYETRFTNPVRGQPTLVLKPGTNRVTEEHLATLQLHTKALRALEAAGDLEVRFDLREPPARRRDRKAEAIAATKPKAPARAAEPESSAELDGAVDPTAIDEVDGDRELAATPDDPEHDQDIDGTGTPVTPTMPTWDAASSYDELKGAATARGIEYPGNVSKAKLLELLEAWDDEQLLAAEPESDAGDEGTSS